MGMRAFLHFSLMLFFLFNIATSQNPLSSQGSAATTTSSVSLTPEMSASAVSSLYSVLATSSPQQPGNGPSAGDVGSSAGTSSGDTEAGATGPSSGSIELSRGAIIAIIVCAVSVCLLGAASAVLWYFAKKRSWEIRASIRKSARRVATALTPRRSTFPKDIHSKRRSTRRTSTRLEDIPGSPPMSTADVEKGKMTSFVMAEPPKKSKFGKKTGS